MPTKRKKNEITEEDIVAGFREIAFSEETKDADRLRALDWLAGYIEKREENEEVMKKLDEVLEFLRT